MSESSPPLILILNVGSATLKFAVYRAGISCQRVLSGHFDRIGHPEGWFRLFNENETLKEETPLHVADFRAALKNLLERLPATLNREPLAAIGHRVVHGGRDFREATRITPEVVTKLAGLQSLAPNHLPAAREVIQAALELFPQLPQVACFDTSFHATIPPVAQRYALPRIWHELGIQRYGFHGLSYQFIVDELARLDPTTLNQRIIIAHLGHGASLCAVLHGQSVDTTMGFTPLSGLVMGTRCGDIDPEIPLYLTSEKGIPLSEVRELLNRQSGLLGMSEISSDVRDLLAVEQTHPQVAEALEVFCYSIRKGIAALTAATQGLDTLVFTAGIGTHSATIRERIVQGLTYLGIRIDPAANARHDAIISTSNSAVTVRVMNTNEELAMARQITQLLKLEETSSME